MTTSDLVRVAVALRADQVLSEEAPTLVPSDLFDQLLRALHEPSRANSALAAAARRVKEIDRREGEAGEGDRSAIAVPLVGGALGNRHQLDAFLSGRRSLDAWLSKDARGAEAWRVGRTLVGHEGDGMVVAYSALAVHLLVKDQLPRAFGHGGPGRISAVLLARLALHHKLRGSGLGSLLLAEALERVVVATEVVAARLVVADAIDEDAAHFFEHHGFKRLPGTSRLVHKMSDVAAAMRCSSLADPIACWLRGRSNRPSRFDHGGDVTAVPGQPNRSSTIPAESLR